MDEKKDWRLVSQENYLKGVTLQWKKYTAYRPGWEHDHCNFCWATLAEYDGPNYLHEGYATMDDYHWICKKCFEDFKDKFEWKVLDDKKQEEAKA